MNSNWLVRVATIAGCTLITASAGTVSAALIFSEDFDNISVPADPGFLTLTTGTGGSSFTTNVTTSGTAAIVRAEIDAANVFGDGTNNQFLRVSDASTSSGTLPNIRGPAPLPEHTAFRLSFDFSHPDVEQDRTGTLGSNGTRVFLTNGSTNEARTVEIRLARRTDINGVPHGRLTYIVGWTTSGQGVHDYPLNASGKHQIDIFGNYSETETHFYGGMFGSQSVSPQSYDLWLDGVRIYDDVEFRDVDATSSTQFGFSGSSTAATSNGLFDNINIWTVPEPGSFFLLGLGIAGLAWGRLRPARFECSVSQEWVVPFPHSG